MKKLTLPLLIFCSACTSSTDSVASSSQIISTLEHPKEPEAPSHFIHQFPDWLQAHLSEDLQFDYDSYLLTLKPKERRALQKNVDKQVLYHPNRCPQIPHFPLSLKYESVYDKAELNPVVVAPKGESSHLLLLLGDEESVHETLKEKSDYWKVWIPSRPLMNYHLAAEGDFWGCLEMVNILFPQFRDKRVTLVGLGKGAEAALFFANNYRYRFDEVAFCGHDLYVDFPNLDTVPIAYFSSPYIPEGILWSGELVVDRIHNRGNSLAVNAGKGLNAALKALSSLREHKQPMAPYQFEDYRYAQVYPWLKVLAKRSEGEPVRVEASVEGRTLHIKAPNATSIQVERGDGSRFPKNVKQVRFNEQLYALQKDAERAVLGENITTHCLKKADLPSGLHNFYRHELLYIVYQDFGCTDTYKKEARELATTLSKLRISGFPVLDLNIPVIPLSRYEPDILQSHRSILIGKARSIIPFIEQTKGYFPLEMTTEGLRIDYKKETIPTGALGENPFAITYPPEKQGMLRLCTLLAAPDSQALTTLKLHYSHLAALYRENDVTIWSRKGERDIVVAEHQFDSYWGSSAIPTDAYAVTRQSTEAWELFLEELLLSNFLAQGMILSPLVHPGTTPPTDLSVKNLRAAIPERAFAMVTFDSDEALQVVSSFLEISPHQKMVGFSSAEDLMGQGTVSLLVETEAIGMLHPEDREHISFQLMPLSLIEIIAKAIDEKPKEFGKNLLRTANAVAEYEN